MQGFEQSVRCILLIWRHEGSREDQPCRWHVAKASDRKVIHAIPAGGGLIGEDMVGTAKAADNQLMRATN